MTLENKLDEDDLENLSNQEINTLSYATVEQKSFSYKKALIGGGIGAVYGAAMGFFPGGFLGLKIGTAVGSGIGTLFGCCFNGPSKSIKYALLGASVLTAAEIIY